MMADVDELTRRFGTLIAQHCMIASILYHTDKIKRPEVYDEAVFTKEENVKVRTDVQEDIQEPKLIIDNAIKSFETQHQVPLEFESNRPTQEGSLLSITTSPVSLCSPANSISTVNPTTDKIR